MATLRWLPSAAAKTASWILVARRGGGLGLALVFVVGLLPTASSQAPNAPTATSPGYNSSPGEVLTTMMPQLCWSGVQGAANYHVTVWRPEDWQSAYREQGYLPSSSTCYQVPNGWLQSGASYRWEVRAFSSGGQPSAWSNVLYFQTPAASTPADLVVNSVSYSPDPPVSGSSVTLTCNYSNSAGGGPAASGFDVRISIDGGTPQSTTSSALAPGSSDSKSFTFSSYAAGSHTVVCTVNDNRAATESNYQNSGATFTKTWSAAPTTSTPADLVVNSVSYSPDPPVSGSSVTLTCNYSNSASGGTAASGFDVRISIDGGTPQSTTSSALAPGSSDSKSFTFSSYAAGSHTVVCTVNDNRAATESNYQNSGATFTKTWSAAPTTSTPADLVVNSVSYSPDPPVSGSSVTLTCNYSNSASGGTAASGFDVKISIDGGTPQSTTSSALAPGSSDSKSFTFSSYAAGSHTVVCTVNDNRAATESNYQNSGATFTKTWSAAPTTSTPADLVVNSVSYSPDPPVSGSSVTLTCNYSNSASGG